MPTKSDLPSFESYLVPTVECLKARGGSMTIEEMEEDVAAAMNLSDELLSVPHGDGPRTQFEYELAWVRTYLKKVGALENSQRGVWRLTPTGAAMTPAELREVPRRVRELDRRRRQARELSAGDHEAEEESELELNWKDQLLEVLKSIQPAAFERLAQRVLRESGFTKVEVMGRSGDGGIDGTGVLRTISCRSTSSFNARDTTELSAPMSFAIFEVLWSAVLTKG
jgi:restriction system protein